MKSDTPCYPFDVDFQLSLDHLSFGTALADLSLVKNRAALKSRTYALLARLEFRG